MKVSYYNTKNRQLHFEIMRMVAVFFVIFNHTGNNGFFLFSYQSKESLQFWGYLFISIFCKFSVPLFFAISGALMLNKPDESLKKIWFNRIPRIAFILLIYSLGYYIYDAYASGGGAISWRDFVIKFYSSSMNHLWYLYLYIAYLAAIPFLKALAKNLDDKYFYYMFLTAIFFQGILPTIEYLFSHGRISLNGNLKITWLLDRAVLYPLLGYFMQYRINLDTYRKKLPTLWLINILSILISCYMTYYKGQVDGILTDSVSQTFHNSYVVINCVSVFITIRYIFENRKINSKLKKIILSIGRCTFGIYLWHVFVQSLIYGPILTYIKNKIGLHMINAFVYCLACMTVSYCIVLILSKIPLLKKVVGF